MAPPPDWVAGYIAGLHHAWAKPARVRGDAFTTARDLGAPDEVSEEWVAGWRQGLDARM